MSHDIFICYSSEDKAVADAMCAVLERNGIRCWIAPRNIIVGKDWSEAIIDAIHGARALVLVFSEKANQSPQVKREVERAVSQGLSVIPIRIQNVQPSKALEYFISTPHWMDAMTPPLEGHLERLATSIKILLWPERSDAALASPARPASGSPSPAVPAPSLASATVPRRSVSRVLRLAALSIGLIGAGIGIFCIVRTPELDELPQKIWILWAPADCSKDEPLVVYGTCSDLRGLAWLQAQMNLLKTSGVRGFASLPMDPRLEVESYKGKANWLLYAGSANERLLVGVGYRREDGAKDGCLRLYEPITFRRRSAAACLANNGRWWIQEKDDGGYRPLDR